MMPRILPVEIVSRDKCYWNIGVDCPKHDSCERCGWNPENIQRRKDRVREKLTEEGWE
jgi:hypothetical protein